MSCPSVGLGPRFRERERLTALSVEVRGRCGLQDLFTVDRENTGPFLRDFCFPTALRMQRFDLAEFEISSYPTEGHLLLIFAPVVCTLFQASGLGVLARLGCLSLRYYPHFQVLQTCLAEHTLGTDFRCEGHVARRARLLASRSP